uniref:Uncharacterized protein n=1 Tax=Arundo donax TaxID=35708 RepID=A0A0A8Y1D9_ARUDO
MLLPAAPSPPPLLLLPLTREGCRDQAASKGVRRRGQRCRRELTAA